jgi:hypothetical protein
VELITGISRAARNLYQTPEEDSQPRLSVFVSASDFRRLPQSVWREIRVKLQAEGVLQSLQEGLLPIAANYPTFPLAGLWDHGALVKLECPLKSLKEVVRCLFSRNERKPMMVQATAIWLWFDSGKLKIFEGLTLEHFPEIELYPDTDLSRKVGSSIRATLNTMFGFDPSFECGSGWPIEFWNRGLALEPCEFSLE